MPTPEISAYPIVTFKARDLKIMKTGYHNDNFLFLILCVWHSCMCVSVICMCAYIRVCACERERETECRLTRCVCEGQRTISDGSPHFRSSWDQVPCWLIHLRDSHHEFQGLTRLCPSCLARNPGLTDVWSHQVFMGSGALNSVPQACMTSSLLPSLPPTQSTLKWYEPLAHRHDGVVLFHHWLL